MFRTASTSLARRRFHLSSPPSSLSSPSSLVNHQSLLHASSSTRLNSTNPTPSSNYISATTKHKPNQFHVILNTQGMIYHQPIVWRAQMNQLRLLSTNNKSREAGSGSPHSSLENKAQNPGSGGTNSNNDAEDIVIFGLDRKRLLIGLGIFATSSAIIALPVATRYMHQNHQEYKEEEVEIDDELYRQMKEFSAEVEGEITQRLLGEELSKKLIEGGKQKAVDNTVSLFTDVINSEALQNAITTLLSNIVTSSQFKGACQMLLKNLWDDLIKDPETTAQVVALLNTAIKDEKIKTSFKELIVGLLRDEEVKAELTSLVVQLGEEQEVLDATRELLTESAHRALNDPEILDHSMEFATDVVGDNVLQRTSGEALRNTVTYAVKPSLSSFLSVFGIALLFLSASALGKARISAREGREIDAAVSVVAKSIGNSFLSKLGEILSMPVHAVSGLTSAIVATLLYPFHVIGKAVGVVSSAGNAALNIAFDAFAKATSFPAFISEIASLSLSSLKMSLSNLTQQSRLFIASLPRVIVSRAKIWLPAAGIFIKDWLQYGGAQVYSSTVSILLASGVKLSNILNSLIQRSRSSLDIVEKQIILGLSYALSNFLAIFRGTSNI